MAEFKYQHGRLSYRRRSTGAERGREDWSLTRNRDGTTTMRALAITEDSKLVRDAILTRETRGLPRDAYIRVQVADRLIGTGAFRMDGDRLHIVADGADAGHTEQTVRIPVDSFSIATHAFMPDAWLLFNYDREKGGEQTRTLYNTATRWEGIDGPLGRLEPFRICLVGEEELTVPVGTFKATHYTLDFDLHRLPTAHVYVTGEDRILLKYDWADYDLEYVLTSWKIE